MSEALLFGRWLKRRRSELGLSQQELAERVDCSLPMLRKLEADLRRPSRQLALLLAAQLGVAADEQEAFVAFARSPLAQFPAAPEAAEPGGRAGEPWRELRLTRTNLPSELTLLIGREDAVAAVRDLLLQTRLRLLTLTGPPGIGKTSLALAVASSLADEFADGVYLVELAPVAQPEGVLPAIAHTLSEAGARPEEEQLAAFLRERQILLLLDNMEHLLDAGPAVVALLKACPRLKVLTTSREALHLRGERLYPVPALALPGPAPAANPLRLAHNPAVRLFAERAAEADPAFLLDESNVADVAAICVMLDGLPLAIELAGGRAALLAPAQIRAALQNRLRLLTSGPRDLPPRQRTLRDAIEWSYALLDPPTQALFAHLGVFLGGCTVEAIAAIITPADPAAATEIAATLLNKNLLARVPARDKADESRLTMLETIREYALERLAASPAATQVRQRHAAYYLEWAENVVPAVSGPDGAQWLARFETEHDNIRAALEWLLESPRAPGAVARVELAIQFCATLWLLWKEYGYLAEGRAWFEAALDRVARLVGSAEPDLAAAQRLSPDLPNLWAIAFSGAGIMALDQGDADAAWRLHQNSLALRRAIGDKTAAAVSLFNLGDIAQRLGDYSAARAYHLESLAHAQELQNNGKISRSLNSLGMVEGDCGNPDLALAYYRESLALARTTDDLQFVGTVLNNMGSLYGELGDTAEARRYLNESMAIHRELEDRAGYGATYLNLASVARDEGKYNEARALLIDAVRLLWDQGNGHHLAEGLEGLAVLAGLERQGERAARLYGAACALRERLRAPKPPAERPRYERYLAIARSHLPANLWDLAYAEGCAMPLDRAVGYALGYAR